MTVQRLTPWTRAGELRALPEPRPTPRVIVKRSGYVLRFDDELGGAMDLTCRNAHDAKLAHEIACQINGSWCVRGAEDLARAVNSWAAWARRKERA